MSRDEHAYKCTISEGILEHLFGILQRSNAEEMAILQQWAND